MTQGSDQRKALGRIALQQRATPVQDEAGYGPEESSPDLEMLKALSEQHGVPGIDLTQVCIRLGDLDLLPREIAERHNILPVLVREDRIFVAMVSPGDQRVIDELEFVTGKKVYPYVALPSELGRALDKAYQQKAQGEPFYIAPHCPQETLQRMGAVPLDQPDQGEEEPPLLEPDQLEEGAVVMDDATEFAAAASDLSIGTDFPNTAEELSGVKDLPEDNPFGIRPAGSARTILVVDDEPDIRRMLVRLLSDRGFEVLEADRGLQALRLVKERVPDIIILDAMLPEVHGFEIARRIKGSERYGHIPIIMISAVYRGWRYAEDVKTSYGVDAYIEKPFRIAEILRAIEEVAAEQGGAKSKEPDEKVSAEAEQALMEGVAAYQGGDIDGAIEHLKRGVAIDPLAYRLHFHLGLLCGKKNLIYEAIQHLERALDINPKHFAAMKNLAVLYQKAGFSNNAIDTWLRAIAVAPDEATKQSIKQLLLRLL